MKKFLVIMVAIALALPGAAFAEKVLKPTNKTQASPIGGRDATDEFQVLNVNPDGSINVILDSVPGSTITTGIVDIPAAGATDRVQMPNLEAQACTIQAFTTNTGSVYVGGATVTNASGANRGLELSPGMPYNDVSVINLNLLYIATDTAGNDVAYLCN